MKKIIFLQPGYAHYRNQLFKILSNSHNIKFIYEKNVSTYPGFEKPDNVNYTFLKKNKFIKWIDLVKYLINDNPDIVISSISTDFRTLLAYAYTKIFRKKFILWIEQWKESYYLDFSIKSFFGKIRNNISKYIILNSDALVVVGTASKEYALSLGKKESEIFFSLQCSNDISIYYNGIDVNYENEKNYKFLFLSRIIPLKGLDILIKAFSTLENDRDDVELIIGGDGPFMEYCKKLANSLNIKKIIFLGEINPNKTWEVFLNADVFILPSYNIGNAGEGWGLVINEAMSMSLPIITTDAVGASYDMVDIGKNGFVTNNGDQHDLYCAMKKILDYDIRKMGKLSRKIFEEKNNYTNMAQGFTDSINYVISLD